MIIIIRAVASTSGQPRLSKPCVIQHQQNDEHATYYACGNKVYDDPAIGRGFFFLFVFAS